LARTICTNQLSGSPSRIGRSWSHGSSPPGSLALTVTEPLFASFQQLIYSESGIWLSSSKKALLCGRLARRLRALQVASLDDYHQLVAQPEQHAERLLMIEAITTNETHFFREPRHFDFLSQEMIPRWRLNAAQKKRSKTIRIWSAGCSSGEEPYSVAMLLAAGLPPGDGWEPQILATDISSRVLATACRGIYSIAKANDIPKEFLHRFMLKGIASQQGQVKVDREIQEMVQFGRINLGHGPYPIAVPFDLILCRNVLIYFDSNSKRNVVNNLAKCLSTDGLLLIGHAENLNGLTSSVRSLAPTIYCKAESYSRLADEFRFRRPRRA